LRGSVHGDPDRHVRWGTAMTLGRGVETSLDEIFAFGLCDKRLQLGGREGVHETCF
jgi:hypothetical protein